MPSRYKDFKTLIEAPKAGEWRVAAREAFGSGGHGGVVFVRDSLRVDAACYHLAAVAGPNFPASEPVE